MILIDLFDNIRGILKRRQVANMLCAEYSYKTDIAVKKEEAFKEGVAEGAQQKAATNLLRMKVGTPEQIAQAQGLPLEKVLELQKSITVEA